jgi:DNA-binding transcriptional MerR regulator
MLAPEFDHGQSLLACQESVQDVCSDGMSISSGSLRIGEFARRVGVNPELLRAWERRYGLLQPVRSPGGFRLYSNEDAERVARMRGVLNGGPSAAEAARAALELGDGHCPVSSQRVRAIRTNPPRLGHGASQRRP